MSKARVAYRGIEDCPVEIQTLVHCGELARWLQPVSLGYGAGWKDLKLRAVDE